jgi:hypothetical protein
MIDETSKGDDVWGTVRGGESIAKGLGFIARGWAAGEES